MPNVIELNLLNNKSIVATMQGHPLSNENSYKIVAGDNATTFTIVSKPISYENATYYVEMVNAKGYGIEKQEIVDDTFKLPEGMAVAGYAYLSISCICDITSTTIVGAKITTDYINFEENSNYTFIYNGSRWILDNIEVNLIDYGINITNIIDINLKENDKIIITKRANVVFMPLKIKVWNSLPTWLNYIREDRLEKQTSLIINSSDWRNNKTTKTLTDITPQKTVVTNADYRYIKEFADAEIEAVSVGINSITFECKQMPTSDIIINVSVYNENTPTEQITISPNDWIDNTCTKLLKGLKLSNTIMIGAEPSIENNTTNFAQSLIQISSVGIDTITFSCEETPTEDIVVVVSLIS